MKILNKIDPSLEPWGTPAEIGWGLEFMLFILTENCLLNRIKLII